jgi:hypothetical protein
MRIQVPIYRVLAVLLSSTAAFAQITPPGQCPHSRSAVDTAGDLGTVPPHIFGSFLEPIDHSINNGVVAEILVNGTEDDGKEIGDPPFESKLRTAVRLSSSRVAAIAGLPPNFEPKLQNPGQVLSI